MFKRARWVSVGAALGFGGSLWAQRKVRAAVERYLPDQVAGRVAERTRGVQADLRDAVAEGRAAMRAREVELRTRKGLSPPRSRRERREAPGAASDHPTRHLRVVEATAVEAPVERRRPDSPKRSPRR